MKPNMTWGSLDQPATRQIIDLLNHRMQAGPLGPHAVWQERIGHYLTAAVGGDWSRLGKLAESTIQELRQGTGQLGLAFKLLTLLMLDGWAPHRFPARARKALGEAILESCSARGRAFKEDFDRQNDNMPFLWLAIQILGGEMLERRDIIALGLEKLRRYSTLMATVGLTSEYCSPNYFPWHIGPLSLVAARARNREARRRAAAWCDFMWFEIAQRWHPGLAQLVGPHSRTYTEEIYGAWSYAHTVMHRLTGAPQGLDPLGLGYRTDHDGDHPVAAYFALAPLCYPAWVRRVLQDAKSPATVEASTIVGSSCDGSIAFHGSDLSTYSYTTPRWSLAGSSRPWNGGWQSNVAVAYWGLNEPAHSLESQRTAYARLLCDDHGPLRANVYRTNFESDSTPPKSAGSRVAFQDDGLCATSQHRNTLLLVSRPKWCCRQHRAIRQTLLISDFAERHPEFRVDGRRIDTLPYRSSRPGIVVFRDGPVIIGLRPTAVTDLGRSCGLEIRRKDKHYWISYWNYHGNRRMFSVDELQAVRNGFLWIIEEADRCTPEALHARLAAAELRDEVNGVYRHVAYKDNHVALALKVHRDCIDPHRTEVNGHDYHCPMFSSRYVQGGFDRDLVVGDALLEANPHPLFLRGDPSGREYAVYNLSGRPCNWVLRLGRRVVRRKDFGFGIAKVLSKDI